MHDHTHDHTSADPYKWLKDAIDIEGEEFEKMRAIPSTWDEKKWKPFPDAGAYQMTRLTSENTKGACNSYYIKLKSGDVFPIHKHPNAIHMMMAVQGEGSILWRDDKDNKKYRTAITPEKGFFAVLPDMEHGILADRNCDFIFLVINAPAEDIHKHDYQVHVHG